MTSATDPGKTGRTLRDIRHALGRRAWLIGAVTLGATVIAAVATELVTPLYQSEAMLRIGSDESRSGMLGVNVPELAGLGLGGLGENEIDTDIGVLRSRQVASTVVDSLALHVELLEPERPRSGVLRIISAPRDAVRGTYVLRRRDDGSYSFRAEKTRAAIAPIDRISVGEEVRVGGVALALGPEVTERAPREIRFEVRSFPETVEHLREEMEVRRQTGRSRLVEIRYRHPDPLLAAAVVNAATDAFIRFKTQTSKVESRSTVEVLRDQIATYEPQLRAAEEGLREFREGQQVISVQDQAEAQIRRLADFQASRDALVIERESLARLLERLAAEDAGTSAYRDLATFPSFLGNGGVQDILQSLIELENERAELLVRRTPESGDVEGITRRIQELEVQLYNIGRSYLSSLDTQIRESERMLARFGGQLQAVPERELQYARLRREQEFLSEIYTFLQTRLKEAEIQEAIELGDARVVDPALVPEEPVTPRPALNLALALVLGLLVGSTVVIAQEMMDGRVRTRDEVVDLSWGAPFLGVLPAASQRSRPGLARLRPGNASVNRPTDPLVLRSAPWAPGAEAYRRMLVNLRGAAGGTTPRTIVVTAPDAAGDSDSVAANLAAALVHEHRHVLLVEPEPRSASLHRLLNQPREPGIVEIAAGTAPVADCVRSIESGVPGRPVRLLTAGAVPRHPSDLPDPAAVLELVSEAAGSSGSVVVHLPDGSFAAHLATLEGNTAGVVIVATGGITARESLTERVELVRSSGVPLLGVVLVDRA